MTKEEAIKLLNSLPYVYFTKGLLHTELYPYKPENLSVLRACKSEVPELRIYETENKFRLIINIEPNTQFDNETPF